jgi:hypothetical protein
LVLAKYFEVEANPHVYSWYRAVVTNFDKSLEKYSVMYFDYGNMYDSLAAEDLVSLPAQYDTLDANQDILYDYLGGDMLIKVVGVSLYTVSSTALRMQEHSVEIYDVDEKTCLSALLNKNFQSSFVPAREVLPTRNSISNLASKLKEVALAQVKADSEKQEHEHNQIKDLNLNKLRSGEHYECKIALFGKLNISTC